MATAPDPPSDPSGEPGPVVAAHRQDSPPRSPGVLVVPALLAVALALLVVGLVTSRSVWLGASLAASVVAAVLLVGERLVQRHRAGVGDDAPGAEPTESTADATGAASSSAEPAGPTEPAPLVDLDAPAIDPDDPEAVWVVDGRPRYHVRDCATIASLASEPIPRSQALADGFVACSLCDPARSA